MNKKVYKFISESGREIVATEDHPFYTKKGWLDGKHLSLGEYVAVYPTLQPLKQPELPTKELGFTIVDKKDIISLAPHRHKHYMKELHTRELLPLTVNNYKIEIIARLLGHLFSDGHCGKYNLEFYCGSEEDAKTIARDISLLGFEASKIRKKHSQITFNGRITNYTTYTLTKGGALHTLLVAAGAPVGKKTDTKVEVPYWIKKTETSVKREFLAALLGGDGPKPRAQKRSERKSGSKVKIDSLLFHKNAIVKESGIQFSHSLKELFEEFDVDVIKMKVKEDYVRKDGSLMFKIELVFGKSQSNIQNILTKIGYRYCQEKEIQANTIGEWLRIRENAINERNSLKEKVQKLYNEGMTPKQITKILGINYRTTQAWIFEKERYKETRLTQRMLPTYQEWFAKVKIGDTGAVFEKIISKEKEDLDDVRDFTTVEDTHSFIANGFITHNCPIETPEGTPIGLRKNQALLCQVTQEEVAEDKLKRSLENLGVRLVK
ncbi:MAG: hypothetical protein Q8R18_04530 [bacterium]|nr:hypothetical protein [bacterium]